MNSYFFRLSSVDIFFPVVCFTVIDAVYFTGFSSELYRIERYDNDSLVIHYDITILSIIFT